MCLCARARARVCVGTYMCVLGTCEKVRKSESEKRWRERKRDTQRDMEIAQAPISTQASQIHLAHSHSYHHSNPHMDGICYGPTSLATRARARNTRPRPHACEVLTFRGVVFGAGILVLRLLRPRKGLIDSQNFISSCPTDIRPRSSDCGRNHLRGM
ncbi:hypothetical protein LX32DRAFT_183749 [Colletotrichum zoysiae]|uniref:Uncharacterized protein n=1 Tax=Colletotrichum zoysiae TaxID=1216348 RepID=A0AAD9LYB5_9PEZI|nr:hypothetical protein LX32DRAFT_183749 [Colletotrichum zoysiae]